MALMNEVLAKVQSMLGIEGVSIDKSGLDATYRAWCLNVPFDNVQKTMALFSNPGQPVPYMAPEQFFENWLEHGTGGTCWPHADALYTLVKSCGFDARRATATMFNIGLENHATTIVRLDDGSEWLLDNAFLTLDPLCISPGSPSLLMEPWYAEVEIDGDDIFVHSTFPPFPYIFFRLLEKDVSGERYEQQWKEMHLLGPFNGAVHIARSAEKGLTMLRGRMLFTKDKNGLHTRELSAEEIGVELRKMGLSEAIIAAWSDTGGLKASMEPPQPFPELPQRIPPSKQTRGV